MSKSFVYVCPNCDTEFISRRTPGSPKAQTYCSWKCYQDAKKALHHEKIYPHVCEFCCKHFNDTRLNARFCSLQCFGKSRRKDNTRTCIACGNKFYEKPCDPRVFCSRDCYERFRPRNSDSIRSFYDMATWRKTAKQIRRRDNYKCTSCGVSNAKCLKLYGHGLQVHHIIPMRLSEDNLPSNLRTLCSRCHTRIEHQFKWLL